MTHEVTTSSIVPKIIFRINFTSKLGFSSPLNWPSLMMDSINPEFGDKYFHINSDKGSRF